MTTPPEAEWPWWGLIGAWVGLLALVLGAVVGVLWWVTR